MRIFELFDALLIRANTLCLRFQFGHFGSHSYIKGRVGLKNAKRVSVGNNVFISRGARIEAWSDYGKCHFEPRIVIRDGVKINLNCHIGAIDYVEIGEDCLIGSNVLIIDHSHGETTIDDLYIRPVDRQLRSKGPIVIGSNVWIGENVVILPGVSIGEGSVIGASSVVTKDLPSYSVAVGNPARVVDVKLPNDIRTYGGDFE